MDGYAHLLQTHPLVLQKHMAKKKKVNPVKQETDYIEFLEKRIASKNYKNNVSSAEYEKTQEKLKKSKLKLRLLTGKF